LGSFRSWAGEVKTSRCPFQLDHLTPQFYFLTLAALTFALASFAQQPTDILREQANETARKLALELSLDDARILQVRRLAYEQLTQANEIAQLYSVDPAMRANKMRVLQDDFATKLKDVVTTAQYNRYLAQHALVSPPSAVAAVLLSPKDSTAKKAIIKSKNGS